MAYETSSRNMARMVQGTILQYENVQGVCRTVHHKVTHSIFINVRQQYRPVIPGTHVLKTIISGIAMNIRFDITHLTRTRIQTNTTTTF